MQDQSPGNNVTTGPRRGPVSISLTHRLPVAMVPMAVMPMAVIPVAMMPMPVMPVPMIAPMAVVPVMVPAHFGGHLPGVILNRGGGAGTGQR